MESPFVSVITPTFNAGPKLAATVASVLSQKGASYEYLIIDGGSTDGTLGQLRDLGAAVSWTSAPDTGIYDAMNKGIRRSAGRFLCFLGAGDRLLPGVLQAVSDEIGQRSPDAERRPCFLYGNVRWSIYPRPYDGPFTAFTLLRCNVCHQAIFYERTLFERLGQYDTKYRLFADWEFNLRCFADAGVEKKYVPLVVAEYESGGESDTSLDPVFYRAFPRLIRQHLGLGYALLAHARFLYGNPRFLLDEPRRRLRRLLPGKFPQD